MVAYGGGGVRRGLHSVRSMSQPTAVCTSICVGVLSVVGVTSLSASRIAIATFRSWTAFVLLEPSVARNETNVRTIPEGTLSALVTCYPLLSHLCCPSISTPTFSYL